jgi:predicted Fe-Mo cluster-binding NifX family protein
MEKGNGVMRIAVTYKDGEVFQHFGHSEQFKLYDTEGEKITGEQIVDTNGSGHGALAGFLQATRVDALICKGIGFAAWCAVEKLHPEVKIWETMTPYFEKRNIHFYVNRCRFHIVEFFNKYHPDPEDSDAGNELDDQFPDGMFRFEKIVK